MNIDDKIFLRSIKILVQDMVKESGEERQKTADTISQLIEEEIEATE
ncbi:MAG: hypothetical protein MJ133_11975 [Lachnospiraceae bacterium]|nr:hypothetical protein [Lachnospiraceae bacterium]